MTGVRTFLHRHAAIALLIVALALAVRALVPTGYMASASPTGLTVELCSGVAGKTITIALPGQDNHREQGKAHADAPCAFSALGQASVAATDPIQIVLAVAFILLVGLRALPVPPLAGPTRLRPPLRGPPLEA